MLQNPGGKTCQILENYNCELTALDINSTRLEKINQNLNRLNLKAKVLVGDAGNKTGGIKKKLIWLLLMYHVQQVGTIKKEIQI